MVFSGLYPTDTDQYEELRDALEKLKLNDASLFYEPETSTALGFGFRCGFLGLLHMEIIQERLEREFDLDLITTVPNVEYRLVMTNGEVLQLENPSAMPDRTRIERDRGAVRARAHRVPGGVHRRGAEAVPRAARRVRGDELPGPARGWSSPTTCRWRRSCWTSTTS